MAETEKGSDDQMTREQRAELDRQAEQAERAEREEEELTAAQPDDGPG